VDARRARNHLFLEPHGPGKRLEDFRGRRNSETGRKSWPHCLVSAGMQLAYENSDEEQNLWRIQLREFAAVFA
jgi:hypothetical protein